MFLPGLTRLQEQHVAGVLHRIGQLPHAAILPDRAAVRATHPARPSSETVYTVAEEAAAQYHAEPAAVAFAFGLAIGLRDGVRFGISRRIEKQRRRIEEEYHRLPEEDRAEIRRLIRILRRGGSLSVLTNKSPTQEATIPTETELDAARRWVREMGVAARNRRERT